MWWLYLLPLAAGPHLPAGRAVDPRLAIHPSSAGPIAANTTAVLYVAMDGVVLERCSEDHAAKRCSALLDRPTIFPAWGTLQERQAAMQSLRTFFANFDIVIWEDRPPDHLQHALAVVGGTSSLIGYDQTICGLGWVSCGGEHRGLVSFAFAHSCGGWESPTRVAGVVAQEVAHGLGLEHTSSTADLMFPTVTRVDQSFVDQCLEIITASYDPADILCGDIHAIDCPQEGGLYQNSRAELMRGLGPHRLDTEAPQITKFRPPDGATFEAGEPIDIAAEIHDQSPVLGVKWTLLEAPRDAGLSRCTNDVCPLGFEQASQGNSLWPFLQLDEAVPGAYFVQLDVVDAHGNRSVLESSFSVLPAVDEQDTDVGSAGETSPDDGDSQGCACGVVPGSPVGWPGLVALAGRRRRRAPVPILD